MFTLQPMLAETTRLLHQQIEDNPFMHALQRKEPLDIPYKWLLTHLYPFTSEGEQKLALYFRDNDEFETSKRLRTRLLLDDLFQLGITPDTVKDSCFDSIDSRGKAIGLLYVLEGSRKGGIFLSALLQKSHSHLPMNYLIGYGDKTDPEWEQFCGLLEHYANTPLQEEIIIGAVSTFEILKRIFHGNGH